MQNEVAKITLTFFTLYIRKEINTTSSLCHLQILNPPDLSDTANCEDNATHCR